MKIKELEALLRGFQKTPPDYILCGERAYAKLKSAVALDTQDDDLTGVRVVVSKHVHPDFCERLPLARGISADTEGLDELTSSLALADPEGKVRESLFPKKQEVESE